MAKIECPSLAGDLHYIGGQGHIFYYLGVVGIVLASGRTVYKLLQVQYLLRGHNGLAWGHNDPNLNPLSAR